MARGASLNMAVESGSQLPPRSIRQHCQALRDENVDSSLFDTPLALLVAFDDSIEKLGQRADRLLVVGSRIQMDMGDRFRRVEPTEQHM